MVNYTQNIINQLIDIYTALERTEIAILKAPKGMGKTYAVDAFLDTYVHNNIINLSKNCRDAMPYQNILDIHPGIKHKSNMPLVEIREHLTSMIQNGEKQVLLIDNYENLCEEKPFIIDFIKFLVCSNSKSIFIIIIENSDALSSLPELSTFTHITKYIEIPQWHPEELADLFYCKYNTNATQIPQETILTLANRAFGNVLNFFDLIEHIKSRQILVYKNNQWNCGDITPEILALKVKEMVLLRYKNLNPDLQAVLKQAAIIGNEFDVSLLNNVFNIEQAYILLNEIELTTALVRKNLNISDCFEFRTCETWMTIKTEIDADRHHQWNYALAQFFTKSSSNHHPHSYAYCECLKKAAFYHKECNHLSEMYTIYYQMLPILINLELYQQALDTIKVLESRTEEIIWPLNCDEIVLLEYKLLCCKQLHFFEVAWETMRNLERILHVNEKKQSVHIQYEKANLLYQLGRVNESYTTISKLYLKYKNMKADTPRLQILHFNILSLLASVEETLGRDEYVSHYNYSLTLAQKYHLEKQYYSQLRKANMAHSGAQAIKLLREAERYYLNRDELEYGMTLHNIGTLKLFSGEYQTADEELSKAAEIFERKGFNGIIYTQNSIAIYNVLTTGDYHTGIQLLSNLIHYMDDTFVKLALLNNLASFQRNLGETIDCEKSIKQIETILSDEDMKFPYFEAVLLLQKGLSAKKTQNMELALNYFIKYMENGFFDYIVFEVFAIKNIIFLCQQLNLQIPDSIRPYANATDILADELVEKELIYCDLEFWE